MELQYKRGDLIPADIFAAKANGIRVALRWASNVSITKRDDGTHLIHQSDGPLIDMSAECEHGGIMCNGHGTVIDGRGFPNELRSRGIQALLFKAPQKVAWENSCTWEYNSEHDRWDTECGDICGHIGNNETPRLFGFKHCPYCGKLILWDRDGVQSWFNADRNAMDELEETENLDNFERKNDGT